MDSTTNLDFAAIQDALEPHGPPIKVACAWLLSVLDHAEEYPASIENDAESLEQLRDRLALHTLSTEAPDDGWILFGATSHIMGSPAPVANDITLLQALQAKARTVAANRRSAGTISMYAADRLIAAAITARDHEGEDPTNPDPIVVLDDGLAHLKAVFVLRFPKPEVTRG